jgi:hypothetical protein
VIPSVVLGIPSGRVHVLIIVIIVIVIVIPASSLLSSHVYYEIERDRW